MAFVFPLLVICEREKLTFAASGIFARTFRLMSWSCVLDIRLLMEWVVSFRGEGRRVLLGLLMNDIELMEW